MLFDALTYAQRRARLRDLTGSGIILLPGNCQAPCNYPNNAYTFRQDSTFLYYFGQNREGLIGVIDCDENREWLLGDDIDIEDIIWTGFVPSVKELAAECGVENSAPYDHVATIVKNAVSHGRKVHFLPP